MISAGETRGSGGLRPDAKTDASVREWIQLVEDGAPPEDIARAEEAVAKALNVKPFELRQKAPFFEKVAKALAGAQAYQSLKLPGKDVVVRDLRDKATSDAKDAANESQANAKSAREGLQGERVVRDGKLVEGKQAKTADESKAGEDKKTSEKKSAGAESAERAERAMQRGGLARSAASQNLQKLLSSFEKMIVRRFEEGAVIEKKFEGDPVFAKKSDAEWSAFFKGFMSRTVAKKVSVEDIKNFLFRGLVTKGAKGVLIGDIKLGDGRVDKFIRMQILGDLIARLKSLRPGETFPKSEIAGMSGEELMYLALGPSSKRPYALSEKASDGRFGDAKAEAMAAESLGMPVEADLRQKALALKKRRGMGLGGLIDPDIPPEDVPYQFIPWWRWGSLSRPGPKRWVTIVFYASLLIMGLIGIAVMSYRLSKGG